MCLRRGDATRKNLPLLNASTAAKPTTSTAATTYTATGGAMTVDQTRVEQASGNRLEPERSDDVWSASDNTNYQ
jgi:hypothetical protein